MLLVSGQVWCPNCSGEVRYREWRRLEASEENCDTIDEMHTIYVAKEDTVLTPVNVADVSVPPAPGADAERDTGGPPAPPPWCTFISS